MRGTETAHGACGAQKEVPEALLTFLKRMVAHKQKYPPNFLLVLPGSMQYFCTQPVHLLPAA
eukprot:2180158-Rhodomonas_salina.3